jgi:hypothetical protein
MSNFHRTYWISTAILVAALALPVAAKKKPYNSGTIKDMTSSDCGYNAAGGNAVLNAVLGTGGQPGKAKELLCKNYTLDGGDTIYTIRPEKDNAQLLPVNASVLFRVDKDKIKLHLADKKGGDLTFLVLGEKAADAPSSVARQ